MSHLFIFHFPEQRCSAISSVCSSQRSLRCWVPFQKILQSLIQTKVFDNIPSRPNSISSATTISSHSLILTCSIRSRCFFRQSDDESDAVAYWEEPWRTTETSSFGQVVWAATTTADTEEVLQEAAQRPRSGKTLFSPYKFQFGRLPLKLVPYFTKKAIQKHHKCWFFAHLLTIR